MSHIVTFSANDDGDKVKDDSWHFVWEVGGSPCKLCTLEVFGAGEGAAVFEESNGKVTCETCIAIIKQFKAVKL